MKVYLSRTSAELRHGTGNGNRRLLGLLTPRTTERSSLERGFLSGLNKATSIFIYHGRCNGHNLDLPWHFSGFLIG